MLTSGSKLGPYEILSPLGGDHPMHPFIIDAEGVMYVDVASATNACQAKNRMPGSPGVNPCTELVRRGAIWRYDANKTNQKFSPAARFATGIRNAEGFAVDSAGRVLVTQHGRDQLHSNWPDRYKPDEEATLPAEVSAPVARFDPSIRERSRSADFEQRTRGPRELLST